MNKVLIIGQAPPAVHQEYPYDTTLLYEMLSWVGITKEKAQEMFEFEAMTRRFPGHGISGHKLPTEKDMIDHYTSTLKAKVNKADMIILLGSVSRDFFSKYEDCRMQLRNKFSIHLIHPSKRNHFRIMSKKTEIANTLKHFLNGLI